MIREQKWPQYGEPGLIPKGIVVHSDSNYSTAEEKFNYYENECLENMGTHFLVDSNGVTEVMPTNWKVRSTGSKWCYDNCIVIHICLDQNEATYKTGENYAIDLIRNLMSEYDITLGNVYAHKSFDSKRYCPYHILNEYGTFKNFLNERVKED